MDELVGVFYDIIEGYRREEDGFLLTLLRGTLNFGLSLYELFFEDARRGIEKAKYELVDYTQRRGRREMTRERKARLKRLEQGFSD